MTVMIDVLNVVVADKMKIVGLKLVLIVVVLEHYLLKMVLFKQ